MGGERLGAKRSKKGGEKGNLRISNGVFIIPVQAFRWVKGEKNKLHFLPDWVKRGE